MHHIFSKISNPFVYGPLTKEEVDSVALSKSLVPEPDGWYLGVNQEIQALAHKKIFKWVPPVLEQPEETPSEESQPE